MTETTAEKKPEYKEDTDEISLLDLLLVLAKNKRLIIGVPAACGLIAVGVALIMTPIFTSKAVIMPPQQQSAGALAALGDLAGLAGVGGGGLKSPGDLYVAMLESRPVQDALVDRFALVARYNAEYRQDARKALSQVSVIKADKKSGLISIEVDDEDPKVAANMAMAYVEELQKMTNSLAISEAARRRLFFEKQLEQAKENLKNAEVALRSTQEKTRMVSPQGQISAIFTAIAQLRGAISAKEVEINALKTFATPQNPDLKVAQQELAALRSQLDRLQRDHPSEAGDYMVPSGRLAAGGIAFVQATRDVKYYETIFELLAKQFEIAKIDEAKESTLIQVIEKAVPAERKSKPKRALIVILTVLSSFMVAILFAFIREAVANAKKDADSVRRLAELKSFLRW
jgi:tyrosine-protein kinase Etk/Wzc